MTEYITITAKKPGFRRAGMAHPDTPTEYRVDSFTDEAIAAIEADPMLVTYRTQRDDPVEEMELESGEPDKTEGSGKSGGKSGKSGGKSKK